MEDDSISITLDKTKTNQDGGAPKDPRHANPFEPDICWVRALGVYLARNAEQDHTWKMFVFNEAQHQLQEYRQLEQ